LQQYLYFAPHMAKISRPCTGHVSLDCSGRRPFVERGCERW
jgi:hypothetical protein